MKTIIELDSQQLNTVIAALRHYQESGQGYPSFRSDWILDLATNGYAETPLSTKDIDILCEHINTSKKGESK